MKKENKRTLGSDLSSYNIQATNYEKIDGLYVNSESSYLETITEEKSYDELVSSKKRESCRIEIDERYSINTPKRIKIRARILNDKG